MDDRDVSDHRDAADDRVGLYEGLLTTRAIRRYLPERVPDHVLNDIFFAATRAPSGSNRQPFRFIVLTDGELARSVKSILGEHARSMWASKRVADSYDEGSGERADSPKFRMAKAMDRYVDHFEHVPVLAFACLVRPGQVHFGDGASVYPACQNVLLAARALGYGGVLTGLHQGVQDELQSLLAIPDDAQIAATITIGRPEGSHGPVRRRPMGELVFEGPWGVAARWAIEPTGTAHTAAGPRHGQEPPERRLAFGPDQSPTQ